MGRRGPGCSGHRGLRASGSQWMGSGRGQGRRVSTQPLPSLCVFIPDHQLTRPLQFPSVASLPVPSPSWPLSHPLSVMCWVIEGIHGPISQMWTLRYRPGSCWIPGHLTVRGRVWGGAPLSSTSHPLPLPSYTPSTFPHTPPHTPSPPTPLYLHLPHPSPCHPPLWPWPCLTARSMAILTPSCSAMTF